AAAHVFAERGYRGASLDLVAAAAGVTKGAVYWNFESKSDLFFALLEERVDRRARELMGLTEHAPREEETAGAVRRGVAAVVEARDHAASTSSGATSDGSGSGTGLPSAPTARSDRYTRAARSIGPGAMNLPRPIEETAYACT